MKAIIPAAGLGFWLARFHQKHVTASLLRKEGQDRLTLGGDHEDVSVCPFLHHCVFHGAGDLIG